MVQAYKGYFNENGQFIADSSLAKIPTNHQVIIVWDDKTIKIKTKPQQQKEALDKLLTTLNTINNEPIDEEFDKILAQGISVREANL